MMDKQNSTQTQDNLENINKDKHSKLCQLFTDVMHISRVDAKKAYYKSVAQFIKNKPYTIRLIYEFIKSYIEARANNFQDEYTEKLMDAIWRLLNERNREYKEDIRGGIVGNFIRYLNGFFEKIIGVYCLPSWMREEIHTTSSISTDIKSTMQHLQDNLQQKLNMPNQDENTVETGQAITNKIMNNYDTFLNSQTEENLRNLIQSILEIYTYSRSQTIEFNLFYGYNEPPLVNKIYKDIYRFYEGNKNVKTGNYDPDISWLLQEIQSHKDYTIPYEYFKKQEDEKAMNNLAEIFAISKENEKQDLDNLNYNTSCFGFCRYDTSTLYNRGIKTMENKITDRYEDYPPPTSCCGMLW